MRVSSSKGRKDMGYRMNRKKYSKG